MGKMIQRFRLFLGPTRFNALLILLGITGISSIVLSLFDTPWAVPAQTVLLLIFVVGAAYLIGGQMAPRDRQTWLATLAPAVGLVLLGVLFFPQNLVAFMGAAFGWTLVGLFIFGRSNAPMQYRTAVKAMRKNDYKAAVEAMDDLIKSEPDEPNHYRFRAELLRLWEKFGRARRDYERMLKVAGNDAERAVAYNGLAEVELQLEQYDAALEAAQKAYDLAPDEWVASYNLGMIQDRLRQSENALKSLDAALAAKVPDSRHRLLIHLYRVRASARLGDESGAGAALSDLRREKGSVKEWETILDNEQAHVLRAVLADDVATAQKLIYGDLAPQALAQEPAR